MCVYVGTKIIKKNYYFHRLSNSGHREKYFLSVKYLTLSFKMIFFFFTKYYRII